MKTATFDYIVTATNAKPAGLNRWSGHCPSHGSKQHRDLSIKLAPPRILVHCFAGCEKPAICASLGIELKDLFTDTLDPDPHKRIAASRQREQARHRKIQRDEVDGFTIDALREADYFVRSRQGLDISAWNYEGLNNELDALAEAHALLWTQELASWI